MYTKKFLIAFFFCLTAITQNLFLIISANAAEKAYRCCDMTTNEKPVDGKCENGEKACSFGGTGNPNDVCLTYPSDFNGLAAGSQVCSPNKCCSHGASKISGSCPVGTTSLCAPGTQKCEINIGGFGVYAEEKCVDLPSPTPITSPPSGSSGGECCPGGYSYEPYATGKNKCLGPDGKYEDDLCTPTQTCARYKDTWTCFDITPPPPSDCGVEVAGIKYGVNTAIGCIDTRPDKLISLSIKLGIGIGSGIAFLLILFGSYKITVSQGQPEAINSGKETITSAIIGLVFIVLSISILQILGFDILGLGSFGLGSR